MELNNNKTAPIVQEMDKNLLLSGKPFPHIKVKG